MQSKISDDEWMENCDKERLVKHWCWSVFAVGEAPRGWISGSGDIGESRESKADSNRCEGFVRSREKEVDF